MDDGLHQGVPWDEYKALKRLNPSLLKVGRKSMKHLRHAIDHPRTDTPQMRLGRVTHTAILERHMFESSVVVWAGGRRCGKKWDEFQAEHAGREIISEDEHANLVGMAEAVAADPLAMGALAGTFPEMTICHTEAETGIGCKGRADAYRHGLLVDLKTTGDIDPHKFGRSAEAFGYHVSLGLYRRWIERQAGVRADVKMIVVESAAPYDVSVVPVDDAVLELGESIGMGLLRQVAECKRTGVWPGVARGEELPLYFPEWAMDDREELTLEIGGEAVQL